MKTPRKEEKMRRWIRARFGPEADLVQESDRRGEWSEWPHGVWRVYAGRCFEDGGKLANPPPELLAVGSGDDLCGRLKHLARERKIEAIARRVAEILREKNP